MVNTDRTNSGAAAMLSGIDEYVRAQIQVRENSTRQLHPYRTKYVTDVANVLTHY